MPELTATDEEVRVYEICILYPLTVTQKEEAQVMKEVEGILEEAGGKQIAKDEWGRRGLAYNIKGHDEGKYIVYNYELDPSKLKEADEALRITPNLLRHIMIKPPKGYQIEKYSEKYKQWLNERESQEEVRDREKEEALKRRVVERAKRNVKKVEEDKKVKEDKKVDDTKIAAKADEAELEQQLEKLISDDLDI